MSKSKTETKTAPDNFEGLAPYLDAKAADRGIDPQFASQAKSSWHAKQITNALASISENAKNPAISDDDRSEIFDRAVNICQSLIAAAEGCADAIVEMAGRHGFNVSLDSPGTELESLKAENAAIKSDSAKIAKAAEMDAAELTKALGEAQSYIKKLEAKTPAPK